MRRTSDQPAADRRIAETPPFQTWPDIMRRVSVPKPAEPGKTQGGRGWHDLVADLIVGRPHT